MLLSTRSSFIRYSWLLYVKYNSQLYRIKLDRVESYHFARGLGPIIIYS